jgi:hypothetical protein
LGVLVAVLIGAVVYLLSEEIIIALVFGLVVLIAPLSLAGMYLRARIADSYYTLEVRPPTAPLRLGQSFDFYAVVLPKRSMALRSGKLTLQCQEHAISQHGSSETHYRRAIFEQVIELAPGRRYQVGEALEIRQRLTIPATAIPSFEGENNFIEWAVILQIPAPGMCPDIHHTSPLRVLPQIVAGADEPLGDDPMVPRNWCRGVSGGEEVSRVGPIWAGLRSSSGPTLKGLPVAPVGGTRRLRLQVSTDSDVHCRGLLACVCCRIHGSGTAEEIVLSPEQTIHVGELSAGANAERAYDIKIPEIGPVSFAGRYVKCDWEVRIRVDVPIWRDKRLHLPFIVTPQLLSARD